MLDSHDWLAHPGSVGRPLYGTLYICDEDGNEQPVFHYHNDPEKTREAQHPRNPNWSAIGDIGYLDADGFLYLTDRKTFMIISGGVNILSSGN
ncbi:Bile acid-coenzyme A ligase [compost metagenome]